MKKGHYLGNAQYLDQPHPLKRAVGNKALSWVLRRVTPGQALHAQHQISHLLWRRLKNPILSAMRNQADRDLL